MAEDKIILSRRLTALAEMVTPGNTVCDLGCDHGFLSIYLVKTGISPGVIAMDVRKGPLSRAQEHVAQYGLGQYITLRLSDGLRACGAGEVDTLVCAGMGGRLMRRILAADAPKAGAFQELLLQPQSDIPAFRAFLRGEGYLTVSENIVWEEGKFYPMMKVVPTGETVPCEDPLFDLFGGRLLRERHPVLRQYLEQMAGSLKELRRTLLLTEGSLRARQRLPQVEEQLSEVLRALDVYYGTGRGESFGRQV